MTPSICPLSSATSIKLSPFILSRKESLAAIFEKVATPSSDNVYATDCKNETMQVALTASRSFSSIFLTITNILLEINAASSGVHFASAALPCYGYLGRMYQYLVQETPNGQ